jgi:lipopolysaccharide transport system permease protein
MLTLRQIQVRYKQSLLGIAWAVLQPLLLMLMFIFIFATLLGVSTEGMPRPIFYYSGLLSWTFFSTSLSFAIPSMVENAPLIRKIYFPRELFPISSVLASFVDFLIAAVIFLGMMVYFHTPFTVHMLFVVPIVLIQIIFTLGICFFASAINVYYRDVRYALPLLIQMWMYASPVIYPMSQVPDRLKAFYLLNPMAGIIDGYRNVLVKGMSPDFYYLGVAAAGSLVLFALCYLYFKRIEMTFADVV